MANMNNIPVTPSPRRSARTPRVSTNLEGFVIDFTSGAHRTTSIEDYQTHIYYSTLDVLLEEMGNRLSESILMALEALVPNSCLFF